MGVRDGRILLVFWFVFGVILVRKSLFREWCSYWYFV